LQKKIEEEMKNMKSSMEKQLAIFKFLGAIYPFKKINVHNFFHKESSFSCYQKPFAHYLLIVFS